MIVGLLSYTLSPGSYFVSSRFWLGLAFYLFLPPFQGSCIFFYHPERLYIDSHYDTTHVLSYIYWNTTYIHSQSKTQSLHDHHHE